MPLKVDKIAINNLELDRRYKLTDNDRLEILKLYNQGLSQNKIAKIYNVSRKSIYLIIYPEKYEESKERSKLNSKEKKYYSKEKHAKFMKEHREYKKKLFKEGLIK